MDWGAGSLLAVYRSCGGTAAETTDAVAPCRQAQDLFPTQEGVEPVRHRWSDVTPARVYNTLSRREAGVVATGCA
jgi:hypothetical protein